MGISIGEFLALAAATALVGFSKTAVSGANTVSLAVFAAVLPARLSTGVLLPLLIAGDLIAVLSYRRHAHWPTLLRLFPAVAAGVVVGTLFLARADDTVVRTSIGAILLLMAGVTVWRRRSAGRPGPAAPADPADPDAPDAPAGAPRAKPGPEPEAVLDGPPSRRGARERGPKGGRFRAGSYGVLGGFTTMVANAGGPVMSLYLISAGFRKWQFLGTAAWFFLIVNVAKVPFSAGLGLIDGRSLLLDAALVAFVPPGAYLGRICADRLNQSLFERLVIAATVLGGLELLVR
ncbi:sulfite exporter TauE/SafE family protein [Streptomyces sp. 8L]|uniref:sulfite exporter TauE/SafE family protein n=1 Tax=Streptomyces sp. 8L TaxID=2877242 RepID=UPI001CD3EDDA|nr:sulfite exporter TauE/SafE family protein [Streptomyces sp. 8L]MCA1221625.1 sulfite exporter TauE/SafE family protein [Streptomyces sp. 8L]